MGTSKIDEIMSDAGERLRREFHGMEFFFILIPFPKEQITHLSTEEMKRMEHTVISSATDTLGTFLKK